MDRRIETLNTNHLVIKNLTKKFGNSTVLHDINLEVEKGSFTTFLGPSGCGKTTLLRIIAGFYDVEEGEVFIGEKKINDTPTHLRNTTMVFQDYALFPHMSIRDNILYGLRVNKTPRDVQQKKLGKTADYLGIDHLLERFPSQLSGGQQQRVALARALVMEPEILLLDEPLSNLDAKLRINIRAELRQLQQQLGITTIYVTHDQGEALALSDKIAVMHQGRIQQYAGSREIYFFPDNEFTARFLGTTNIFSGVIQQHDTDCFIPFAGEKLYLTPKDQNSEVKISLRPEMIEIFPGRTNEGKNRFIGKVTNFIFEGFFIRYWVETKGETLLVDVHNPGTDPPLTGDVTLHLPQDRLHILTL